MASSNINVTIISGNLVRDPELRYSASGNPMTNMTVAVNRSVQRGNEWVSEADFIPVTVFGNQAEPVSQYLTKGQRVTVEGRISYQAKGEGPERKYYFNVVANRVEFPPRTGLRIDTQINADGVAPEAQAPAARKPAAARGRHQAESRDDDEALPF